MERPKSQKIGKSSIQCRPTLPNSSRRVRDGPLFWLRGCCWRWFVVSPRYECKRQCSGKHSTGQHCWLIGCCKQQFRWCDHQPCGFVRTHLWRYHWMLRTSSKCALFPWRSKVLQWWRNSGPKRPLQHGLPLRGWQPTTDEASTQLAKLLSEVIEPTSNTSLLLKSSTITQEYQFDLRVRKHTKNTKS